MARRIKGCGRRLESARWKALWNNKNDNDAKNNTVKTETLKGKTSLEKEKDASRLMENGEKLTRCKEVIDYDSIRSALGFNAYWDVFRDGRPWWCRLRP